MFLKSLNDLKSFNVLEPLERAKSGSWPLWVPLWVPLSTSGKEDFRRVRFQNFIFLSLDSPLARPLVRNRKTIIYPK